jgi:2-polyprenyl-3-methyl-5-hydroxy-6-metoxy-1,4-benzoquinol methylase
MKPVHFSDSAAQTYQQTRIAHWDSIARKRDSWRSMGNWYHRRLQEIYRFHVHPNQSVLELGCAEGNLLASLKRRVASVDFSNRNDLSGERTLPRAGVYPG